MPEWSQNYPGIMPECPGMPRDGKTLFEMRPFREASGRLPGGFQESSWILA
jgi:hypothetical protein